MSYWDIFNEARRSLDRRKLVEAEHAFDQAQAAREKSPGRIFLSETVGNAARKILRSVRQRPDNNDEQGKWERSCDLFRRDFLVAADALIREATYPAFGISGSADRDVLEQAVLLTSRSVLVEPDSERCACLTTATLEAAARGGWLPQADLLPRAGFLVGDTAIDVAGKVLSLICSRGGADSDDARALADSAASLIASKSIAPGEDEVRCRLRGELLDQAGRLVDALGAYDEYLLGMPAPSADRDRLQLRTVRLLANADAHVLPVPRYAEAQRISNLYPPGEPACRAALAEVGRIITSRRTFGRDAVWAAVGGDDDRWWFILWHGDQPLDVAHWSTGSPDTELMAFLLPCGERILGCRIGCPHATRSLDELASVMIADSPESGPADLLAEPICLSSSHPSFTRIDAIPGLMPILAAGRAWSKIVIGLIEGDTALRTGLHALARAGDGPSRLIAAFLPPELVPASGWPLSPLWERPAPVLPTRGDALRGCDPMADLAQAGHAVVTSGRPGRVLASWGARRGRWRIVLDQATRLCDLGQVLQLRGGERTILPLDGFVDDPVRAINDLEALLARPVAERSDTLPLFHWIRMCRTHNGDLGDALRTNTSGGGSDGPAAQYLRWLSNCRRGQTGDGGRWRQELETRVTDSDVVVGSAAWLEGSRDQLSQAWGVDADRPAAWVFCDAAVLLWRLTRRDHDSAPDLHRRLKPFSEATLLIATGGVFLRADLEEQLIAWLDVGGNVVCRASTDVLPPLLELGDDIPVPGARVALGELVATLVDHAAVVGSQGRQVLWALPGVSGPLREALMARASGVFGDPKILPQARELDEIWRCPTVEHDQVVVIPRLESLDGIGGLGSAAETHAGWRRRDSQREQLVAQRRGQLALEVNAWLGRGGETVVITDSRWWRDLPTRPEGSEPGKLLGAEEAKRLAAGDAAILRRCVSLDRRSGSAALASRRWLQEQGWLEADGLGLPEGWAMIPEGPPPSTDADRTCGLHIGPAERHWFDTLRACWQRSEKGRLDDWLLVVADTPPRGADALAAASTSPRSNAPAPGDRSFVPAPLVWVTPGALQDSVLRRQLAAARPTEVWVSDLRRWLPSDHGAGQEFVGALGFLLRDLDSRVRLHASHLPEPWRETLVELLRRRRGALVELTETQMNDPGESPPVAVVRCGRVEVSCPGCSHASELREAEDHCPECGLNLLRWQSAAELHRLPDRLRREKIAALAEREQSRQAAANPLCVWIPSRELLLWTNQFDAAGVSWLRAESHSLGLDERDGSWLVCLLDDQPVVPAECRHVLLVAPQDAEELADLRQRCAGELALWFHPLELDLIEGAVGRQATLFDESQPLRAAVLEAPVELTPPWRWEGLLSPRLQEIVTGAPAAQVRRAVGALSWLAAVDTHQDGMVAHTDDQQQSWISLLTRMELEFRMSRLDPLLETLLSAMLGDLPPGAVGAVDLAALPLDLDDQDLAWLDRFLLSSSMRVDEPGLQLLYEPDGGLRHGTHRRVGRLGEPDVLIAALRRRRDLLVEVLAGLGDGESLSQNPICPEIEGYLEAGILLGWGRLEGAPGAGDLLAGEDHSLANRVSGGLHAPVSDLLRGLNAQHQVWRERLIESWRIGFFEDVPRLLPAVIAPRMQLARESEAAVEALASFFALSTSGLRVLEGARGSGRTVSLVAALIRACRNDLPARRITVISPDLDGAARFQHHWRRWAPGLGAPEMIVGSKDAAVASRFDPSCLVRGTPTPITVVLGFEAMPSALRFRLANRIGEQRLVVVLEPVLLQDAWEHLLPLPPDEDQIIRTGRLQDVSRLIRDDLADIVEILQPERPLPRTVVRERGVVESVAVAGLDNAMAMIDDRLRDAGLEQPVELVAPTLEDLEYIGRSAARLGWLPVYSWELALLRQPGTLEFLSVLCDAASCADDRAGESDVWTSALILPEQRKSCRHWLAIQTDPDQTLTAFWARLSRARWAEGLFHGPREAARITNLVLSAPDESLRRFAARPLMEVWRHAVATRSGEVDVIPSGPVMVLTTPERAGEGRTGALVYLCSGTESDRQHYAMLSRADQRILVLHQGISPLLRDRS